MAKILIPTDYSDPSRNAAAYALDLFGASGNTFILMNAFLDPMPNNLAMAGVSAEVFEAAEGGMRSFEGFFRGLKNVSDAEVRTTVRYGPVSTVVEEACEEEGVDVVVMGTQGKTAMTFLGTNAAEVAKACKTPVMVVPSEARFSGLRRILFADDHRSVEPLAMRLLVKLARLHAADVMLVHVTKGPQEEPDPRIIAAYDETLGNVKHSYFGANGPDVAIALSEIAQRDKVDLAVVLHRHLGVLDSIFHKSVAKQLAMHIHLPLLVLEH